RLAAIGHSPLTAGYDPSEGACDSDSSILGQDGSADCRQGGQLQRRDGVGVLQGMAPAHGEKGRDRAASCPTGEMAWGLGPRPPPRSATSRGGKRTLPRSRLVVNGPGGRRAHEKTPPVVVSPSPNQRNNSTRRGMVQGRDGPRQRQGARPFFLFLT